MPEPYGPGDFVWCRFPFSEAPEEPGPEVHVGYIVDVAAAPGRRIAVAAALYTTTSPLQRDAPVPLGVIPVDAKQAGSLGQKAFLIDARRIAYMPINEAFFPELEKAGSGILGKASQGFRTRIERVLVTILRRPDLLELMGPEAPKPPKR